MVSGQWGFRSMHPGGVNFLFGDGSVHFIKNSIDMGNLQNFPMGGSGSSPGVYRKLSTRWKGDLVSADSY
jgi:prepilin-type processing-associated H-X9-DG protein